MRNVSYWRAIFNLLHPHWIKKQQHYEPHVADSTGSFLQVLIVLFVVIVGAFKVDVSNWTPFAPNGFKSILTGATVVFFSYVGFDAVANSAEESKRPQVCQKSYKHTYLSWLIFYWLRRLQSFISRFSLFQRDLPFGIIGSLLACLALYVGVCLVITGMVPYQYLGEDAPLAEAFTSRGMKYVSILISFGAVAGLTTTLLVGLYVQVNCELLFFFGISTLELFGFFCS